MQHPIVARTSCSVSSGSGLLTRSICASLVFFVPFVSFVVFVVPQRGDRVLPVNVRKSIE
jgi:hypothetical protein